MRPAYSVLANDGKDCGEPQLNVVREMVMQQCLQTMMIYGVAKIELNERKVGGSYVLSPKITDLEITEMKRPKAFSLVRNSVFTHWSRMLFIYGFTKLEMNPNEQDIERITKLWKEATSR